VNSAAPLECGGSTPLSVSRSSPREGRGIPRLRSGQAPRPYVRALHRTAKALLLVVIRLYQAFVSPVAFSACKFHPSCSRYAYEAVERHGARRGGWLALKRLWRCRPFGLGGHDPVPEILEEVQ